MRIILFLFLLITSFYSFSQSGNVMQEIDAYLTDYKEKVPIPGFSVVIVQEGEITFLKGYGVEKEGESRAMTPQSACGIGDLTMSMTALAMMQLVEQGKVALDDQVIKYIPWFRTANKEFSDQITIRMLLSHTAGIPSQFESIPNLDLENALEQFVISLNGYYINQTPGLSYEYSREGYAVAGLIISKVSGMSYAEYMQKNVFDPLEMRRTSTDLSRFDQIRAMYGHEMSLEKCIPAEPGIFDGNYVPAGSEMRSTAEDLGHYLIALLNGGQYKGKNVISSESIEEIWTPQTSFNGLGTMLGGNGLSIEYGLGWLKMNIDDRDIILHPGNTGNMSSITGLQRENKVAVAILFNADSDRLDRYVYPSIQNIGNNIIHLLSNEPTTDFANTRFDDPTENDYDLPRELWEKYTGDYISIGGAHPIYKDYNIKVYMGESDSLELKAYKEGIEKGHFKLDFSNESRIVLRSIVQPRAAQFKLNPNGAVMGLFIYGSEFKKKDPRLEDRFTLVSQSTNPYSFLFPKKWEGSWENQAYTATHPSHANVKMKLQVNDLGSEAFDFFITSNTSETNIKTKGILKKEAVKNGIWTEQAIFTEADGQTMQQLFVLYEDPISNKQLQIVLSNPWGQFTSELQEIMMQIQKSVQFN